jgi:hypothetical protein
MGAGILPHSLSLGHTHRDESFANWISSVCGLPFMPTLPTTVSGDCIQGLKSVYT